MASIFTPSEFLVEWRNASLIERSREAAKSGSDAQQLCSAAPLAWLAANGCEAGLSVRQQKSLWRALGVFGAAAATFRRLNIPPRAGEPQEGDIAIFGGPQGDTLGLVIGGGMIGAIASDCALYVRAEPVACWAAGDLWRQSCHSF